MTPPADKMKVLQINNCHYRRGGADIVYLNTGMLLEKKEHDVSYFSALNHKNIQNVDSRYFVKGVDFFRPGLVKRIAQAPRFIFSFEALRNLSCMIRDTKPDVAHVHFYKGTLTSSILVALRRHNIPVVATLHDFALFCPVNLCIDGKKAVCDKCRTSWALNCVINRCNRTNACLSTLSTTEFIFHKYATPYRTHFNKVIAVSQFSYNQHKGIKGILPLLTHLYNFYPGLGSSRPKSTRGEYYLLFSRLSREKGILTLLKAWKASGLSNRELVIAGAGPQEHEIRSFIARESIEGVRLVGYMAGKDLEQLIENSSFVLVPSEWYENNPMSIIEAYSLGKPVIGSNIGGIPELIEETGFLFESGNHAQLARRLKEADELSDAKYSAMSVRARKFAERHFSEEAHYSRLLEIYRDAVASKRAG